MADTMTLFTKEAVAPYNKNEVFTVSKKDGKKILDTIPDKIEEYDEDKHAKYLPTSREDLERQEREAKTKTVTVDGSTTVTDTAKADDLQKQLDESNAAREAAEKRATEAEQLVEEAAKAQKPAK